MAPTVGTRYALECRGSGLEVPAGSRLFTSLYRSDRCRVPPNIQWVFAAYPSGVKAAAAVSRPLQLVLKSREQGDVHPLLHTPSWRKAWLLEPMDS
jgi:hypothetical protein